MMVCMLIIGSCNHWNESLGRQDEEAEKSRWLLHHRAINPTSAANARHGKLRSSIVNVL